MDAISPASLATTRAELTPSRRSSRASMSSAKTSLGTTDSTTPPQDFLRELPDKTFLFLRCVDRYQPTTPSRLELGESGWPTHRPVDQHPFSPQGRLGHAVYEDPYLGRLRKLGCGVDELPKPGQHDRAPASRLDLAAEIEQHNRFVDTQTA